MTGSATRERGAGDRAALDRIRLGRWSARLTEIGAVEDLAWDGTRLLDAVELTVRGPSWESFSGELVSSTLDRRAELVQSRRTWSFSEQLGVTATMDVAVRPEEFVIEVRAAVARDAVFGRIGLCLLHPLELAGAEVDWRDPSGTWRTDAFTPELRPFPFFSGASALRPYVDGLEVELELGELRSETEDHRNWADPGWKTYLPPLSDGPVALQAGEVVRHRVVVRVIGAAARDRSRVSRRVRASQEVVVSVDERRSLARPGIGCHVATDDGRGSIDVGPVDAGTGIDHLFVEIEDTEAGQRRFALACRQARRRGIPLAVTLSASTAALPVWAERIRAGGDRVAAVVPFDPELERTTPASLDALRASLDGVRIEIGSGVRGYPAELLRALRGGGLPLGDFVMVSLSSQVHSASTDRALQTVRALPQIVTSLRAAVGAPVWFAPITFAERRSVHLPRPDDSAPWTRPPDPRTRSSSGAVWGIGVMAGLRDAAALSFGDLDGESPSPLASVVDAAALGSEWLAAEVSNPRSAVALGVRTVDGLAVLVGGIGPAPVDVRVEPSGETVQLEPGEYVELPGGIGI